MRFPPPKTEDPQQRFEDLTIAARHVLEEVVASANEAGWGTEEITVALTEAARFLGDAKTANPNPADDPSITDAVREQIGHGEQFD